MDKRITSYSLWATDVFTIHDAMDPKYAAVVTEWARANPLVQHDNNFVGRDSLPIELQPLHDYCYSTLVDLIESGKLLTPEVANSLHIASFASSVITNSTPQLQTAYQTHNDIFDGPLTVVWYPSTDLSSIAGGDLIIHSPNPITAFSLGLPESFRNYMVVSEVEFNKVVVFPAALLHRVLPYNSPTNIPRVSIAMFFTYDDDKLDKTGATVLRI